MQHKVGYVRTKEQLNAVSHALSKRFGGVTVGGVRSDDLWKVYVQVKYVRLGQLDLIKEFMEGFMAGYRGAMV